MKILFHCKDISEHASEYLDHETPALTRMRFRLHLLLCDACRRFVTQLDLTKRSLSTLGTERPSDELVESQLAKIKQKIPKQE